MQWGEGGAMWGQHEAGYWGPGGSPHWVAERAAGRGREEGALTRWTQRRQRCVPRNGSRSKGSPVTRRDPWHQKPGIGDVTGKWAVRSGSFIQPPWWAQNGCHGKLRKVMGWGRRKECVDPASTESLPLPRSHPGHGKRQEGDRN